MNEIDENEDKGQLHILFIHVSEDSPDGAADVDG